MNKRGACPVLLVLLTLAISGLAFSPAQATTDGVDHALHHHSLAVWISLALLALGGACLAAAIRRGRRVATLTLALLIALFGLESAVHSVHHLADPQAAASCAVLSASQHAPGTCVDIPDVGAPTWTAEPSPAGGTEIIRPLQAFGPPEGRAPPALPAV